MNHSDDSKTQNISLDTLVEAGLLEKAEDGKYRPGTPSRRQPRQQQESGLSRQIADLQDQIKSRDVLPAAEKRQRVNAVKAAPVKPAPATAATAKADDVDLNAITSRF